jgi:hypothetical protein
VHPACCATAQCLHEWKRKTDETNDSAKLLMPGRLVGKSQHAEFHFVNFANAQQSMHMAWNLQAKSI